MTNPASPQTPASPEFEAAVNAVVDHDRLRLLEVGFYIAGVVTILGISILLFHFTILLGLGLTPHLFEGSSNSNGHENHPPPPGLFLGLAGLVGTIILLGWTFGGLQIYAGRCIKYRCHALFVLIVASVECIFIPWGTLLGVCTFLVMERPSVKVLFGRT